MVFVSHIKKILLFSLTALIIGNKVSSMDNHLDPAVYKAGFFAEMADASARIIPLGMQLEDAAEAAEIAELYQTNLENRPHDVIFGNDLQHGLRTGWFKLFKGIALGEAALNEAEFQEEIPVIWSKEMVKEFFEYLFNKEPYIPGFSLHQFLGSIIFAYDDALADLVAWLRQEDLNFSNEEIAALFMRMAPGKSIFFVLHSAGWIDAILRIVTWLQIEAGIPAQTIVNQVADAHDLHPAVVAEMLNNHVQHEAAV